MLGHATKGIVYVLVGALALLTVFDKGGKVAGEEGAVRTIGEQPFGRALLLAAAVGLACYALSRLLLAVLGQEGERGMRGAGKRLAALVSSLTHAALALTAFQLALGRRAKGHEGESRAWVARVLDWPHGDALVATVGLCLVAFAVYQLYCAAVARFPETLEARVIERSWVKALGRIGLGARGVVFAVIGAHLVAAGLHQRAHHTRDIGGALRELAARPYGAVVLATVAGGLAAYGFYQLVVARYGRVPGA